MRRLTLIELLVVISITLLIAILLPALSSSGIGSADTVHRECPFAGAGLPFLSTDATTRATPTRAGTGRHENTSGWSRCSITGFKRISVSVPKPTRSIESNEVVTNVWFGTASAAWREDRGGYPEAPWTASYGFNGWMHSEGNGPGVARMWNSGRISMGIWTGSSTRARRPCSGTGCGGHPGRLCPTPPASVDTPLLPGSGGLRLWTSSRHQRHCNLSYADGSAGPLPIEDLKRVMWHRQWVEQDYTGLPNN